MTRDLKPRIVGGHSYNQPFKGLRFKPHQKGHFFAENCEVHTDCHQTCYRKKGGIHFFDSDVRTTPSVIYPSNHSFPKHATADTPQKSNELIPKMAIFEAGVTFSKAHHFGYPAVSFRGCTSSSIPGVFHSYLGWFPETCAVSLLDPQLNELGQHTPGKIPRLNETAQKENSNPN